MVCDWEGTPTKEEIGFILIFTTSLEQFSNKWYIILKLTLISGGKIPDIPFPVPTPKFGIYGDFPSKPPKIWGFSIPIWIVPVPKISLISFQTLSLSLLLPQKTRAGTGINGDWDPFANTAAIYIYVVALRSYPGTPLEECKWCNCNCTSWFLRKTRIVPINFGVCWRWNPKISQNYFQG